MTNKNAKFSFSGLPTKAKVNRLIEQSGARVITITPQLAKLWLDKNIKNRKISPAHVNKLALEMQAGRWVLNGQTICFSSDGILNDGQHRLCAVVQSGITIQSFVAFGIDDPNAFATYNSINRNRNVCQLAEMRNINNASRATAIAKRLLAWDMTPNKEEFTLTTQKFTSNMSAKEILDYLEANNAEIQAMINDVRPSLPCRKCKAGTSLIAALIICSRHDDVNAMVFIDGLKDGSGLNKYNPMLTLRERLIDPPSKRISPTKWETEVMALTIKSYNKFIKGKKIKYLRWTREGNNVEKFPIPGGN